MTNDAAPGLLFNFFRFIIRKRWWVVGIYALLLGPSTYFALRVDQDNSLDRLIVKSDPDYIAARDFAKVFGSGEYVLLLCEADDPFDGAVLRRVDDLERKLAALPKVEANSALAVYRRARAGFSGTPDEVRAFRAFVTGTDIFRKQGLVGDHFLSIPLILDVHGTRDRLAVLSAIDGITAEVERSPAPLRRLRKVGQSYINAYLDADTRQAGMRYFPLFFLFVLALNISLYRSFRALLAFLVPLGVSAALTVGYVGVTGGTFSIISTVVPMSILIVCTANLVYIHSRFVDHPPGLSVGDHQLFALCNKFLACTASIFATAVGFAALCISKIRPIREMGIWVAVGLLFTWIVVFTLFPALQKILNTPTQQERKVAGQWFLRFVHWLPIFSYRFRWLLVPGSFVLCILGAVALFGIPHVLPGMKLETNAIEYVNHRTALYQNTKEIERAVSGLALTEVWLKGGAGSISQPAVLRALSRFQDELERGPGVTSVVGLPSILRTLRYLSGKGDRLPEDDASLEKISDDLETLLPREPMLQRFVEKTNLAQTHLTVVSRTSDYRGFERLRSFIEERFAAARAREPALAGFTLSTTGLGPLQAKISYHLVPTLVESFILTVAIIFATFLLVFRNGAARLMAMIPSLFAILVMFGIMRLFGMTLNVASILIASTVLGTSENDQIHFFYHFQERRRDGNAEQALQHTLLIAGRAIIFATLINAGGFLAFALADLPPIREFGALSALAFVLSMLADFSALPAALWIFFGERPESYRPK